MYSELQKKIGYKFKDENLLKQALTHKSYTNENKSARNNERLEFFGDAILQYFVTIELFNKFPSESEGLLSAYRSALVSGLSLGKVAEKIGVKSLILTSVGQRGDMERNGESIIQDAVESLIGAMFLDSEEGKIATKEFINNYILSSIDEILENELWVDSKTKFQEKSQSETGITPTYRVLSEDGPEHERKFTVAVYLDEEKISEGTGRSKQQAQQDAAKNALQCRKW